MKRKPCGCVKMHLPASGKVAVRCKPAKKGWKLAYFDDNGIVRRA